MEKRTGEITNEPKYTTVSTNEGTYTEQNVQRTTELTIAHRKPSGSFSDVWSAQKIPWCLSISRLCFIMKIPSWGKS